MSSEKVRALEREITQPLPLCNEKGRLLDESIGWSRRPFHHIDLQGNWLRRKRWNFWSVTNEEVMFTVAMTHFDYVRAAFAYLYDLNSGKLYEEMVIIPFSGNEAFPNSVDDDISLTHKKMNLSFINRGSKVEINVQSPDFTGKPLEVNLHVAYPDNLETLNVVIPWSRRKFQFTSKHNCIPTSGQIKLGEKTYHFHEEDSYASLDFGRGIWPYHSFWNWATFSGIVDGKTIGINLGGTWTDGTGMTENAIIYDQKIYKIGDDVQFTYSPQELMRPWLIKTENSDYVDLYFEPLEQRTQKTNLVIFSSNMYQMIGRFSGRVRLANDKVIEINQLIGTVEEHRARW